MAEWFKRAFDDDRDALVPPPISGPEGRRVGLVRVCASLGVNLSHAHRGRGGSLQKRARGVAVTFLPKRTKGRQPRFDAGRLKDECRTFDMRYASRLTPSRAERPHEDEPPQQPARM